MIKKKITTDKIIPIIKVGDPYLVQNHRGIVLNNMTLNIKIIYKKIIHISSGIKKVKGQLGEVLYYRLSYLK